MKTNGEVHREIKMMIHKRIALLFFGIIILFSCKNSRTTPVIYMDKINQFINLELSDILTDISVVQISSDYLFSVNDLVYVASKYLIICNPGKTMHLFTRNGTYIRKLAERGNGPGEFLYIEDIYVDEEENILYYTDMGHRNRCLSRIELSSGMALDPLQVDFTCLTANYINGIVYSFPNYKGLFQTNEYPDSATVFSSTSLPSGEVKKYKGGHS